MTEEQIKKKIRKILFAYSDVYFSEAVVIEDEIFELLEEVMDENRLPN